jgi:hypothetical protein
MSEQYSNDGAARKGRYVNTKQKQVVATFFECERVHLVSAKHENNLNPRRKKIIAMSTISPHI